MRELSLNNCRLDKRYDVHERLGRGSYAEIFLARDILASTQSPHSCVVIKALNVFLQDDLDEALERTLVENFQNEAAALDRVRHPNIISRLGHGTARDLAGTAFHYLVLEYLPGGDMQQLLRRNPISLARGLHYIEQICAGLGFAHQRSIIHRDIKPQNLLLSADLETLKIADFGVARISAADSPITRVGTNIYAPPEHSPLTQLRTGELRDVKLTPASDVYSLAKTVYTMLTGETPRAFANEPVGSLPAGVEGEPWADELLTILRRATDKDPGARHQSVEEFWGDLLLLKRMAEDEFPTMTRSAAVPQPQVSRGYTPFAPEQPSFEKLPDLPSVMSSRPIYVSPVRISAADERQPGRLPVAIEIGESASSIVPEDAALQVRPKRRLRRFAAFAILLAAFTGILYGTASFVRNNVAIPGMSNPFRPQTAVASTDIYLRSTPNTDKDPIGLVTKNSRLRIVNSQNNWYQVDVIQQGRDRSNQPGGATRGWLNGKYLEITEN